MIKCSKRLKKLLIIWLITLNCLAFGGQVVYAIVATPILNLPLNTSLIPYYQTFLKWYDVANEHHYLISVRDLTTNTLVRNRVVVNPNSTYYSIPSADLIKGHQYRWAVAAVDAYDNEAWSTARTFFTESTEPHVWPGGYTSASHLDFWVKDQGDTNYGDNILQAGAEMWNGVTDNVYLHRDWNATDYEVGIVKSYNGSMGMLGYTVNFNGDTELSNNDITSTWTFSVCYIYENNLAAKPDWFKRANVAHEIGHALSLGHTEEVRTKEIMDSGNETALPSGTTDIDRTHLRIKWGWQ